MGPSNESKQAKLIFITGTNTGTGKTLLTCLGLHQLRKKGLTACGLKPFCSGSRGDAHRIRFHSGREWQLAEVNPWFFTPPLSPGAMPKPSQVSKSKVLEYVEKKQKDCTMLLVEGAGGLMSPLGSGYHFGDLINHFKADTVLAAPNRLGVLNQVLLNVHYLRSMTQVQNIRIVLMGQTKPDLSSKSNASVLRRWLPDCQVIELPYLGPRAKSADSIQSNSKKLSRKLAAIFPC